MCCGASANVSELSTTAGHLAGQHHSGTCTAAAWLCTRVVAAMSFEGPCLPGPLLVDSRLDSCLPVLAPLAACFKPGYGLGGPRVLLFREGLGNGCGEGLTHSAMSSIESSTMFLIGRLDGMGGSLISFSLSSSSINAG